MAIAEAFGRVSKYYKHDRIRCPSLSVSRYTAKEMQPFSTVEKPGFKEVLQKFDKQYKLPKLQSPIYATGCVKDDTLKNSKEIDFYSATTDMWSSSNMTPYVS